MEKALGLIEIQGLATAVMVADVMAKTANVEVVHVERAQGSGWMTIKISGDVAAVGAAVSAGRRMGELHGKYVSSKVIPRPSASVCKLFGTEDVSTEEQIEEPTEELVIEVPPIPAATFEITPVPVKPDKKRKTATQNGA